MCFFQTKENLAEGSCSRSIHQCAKDLPFKKTGDQGLSAPECKGDILTTAKTRILFALEQNKKVAELTLSCPVVSFVAVLMFYSSS